MPCIAQLVEEIFCKFINSVEKYFFSETIDEDQKECQLMLHKFNGLWNFQSRLRELKGNR